jgi:hypothetical protein
MKIYYSTLICLSTLLVLQGCALKPYQTVNETKEVGKAKYLMDEGGQKTLSLSAANIDLDGKLTLTGFTFSELTQYEGPQMEQITKESRPPDPIGALTNTALTFGLNVLLEPRRTGGQLVGDTRNERVTNSYIDKTRGAQTGVKVWQKQQVNLSTQILVEGILDRAISLNYSGGPIDLSRYFQESPYDKLVQVKVTCQTCGEITRIQAQDFRLYGSSKVVEFDLGAYKHKIKNQKMQAEKEEQKKIGDQKPAAASGQQKCLRMGLAIGTDDYKLCIASQK